MTAALLLGATGVWAETTESFTIIANGEPVGRLEAVTDGAKVSVDYHVDNNGRGPKHREALVMGAGGVPLSWTISGTSLMGGRVEESYRWANGRAQWVSQADKGSVKAATPPLYVVNDGSPWASFVYAGAAGAGGTLPVLPGGQLKVEKLRSLQLGGTAVTAYRLSGVQLAPGYVLLDADGRLFAAEGASQTGLAIRKGHEAVAPEINRLTDDLELEHAIALQKRLAHRHDGPIRIRNVHVLDPASGERSALSDVTVMRGLVVGVQPHDPAPPPADQLVVEGDGGTLYPGLHDMHAHASLGSGLFYLAAGVTSTRDMGNDNGFLQRLLTQIDKGEVAWPRIVPAGFIEGRSPFSARHGFIPATVDDGLNAVRWYADHGYAEIKIYNSMNPDWVKPLASEAHRLGLRVSGHVPAFTTPDRMIADGYDAIAHSNQLLLGWILKPGEDSRTPLRLTAMARAGSLDLTSPPVRRTVELMKSHEVALDTTAVILEQLMLSRAGQVPPGQDWYLSSMPIGFQRYRKRSFVTIDSPQTDAAYRSGFAKVLETIALLHREGVRLLPGTDDPTGFTVLREVELYVKAGLTPAEALRAATLGAEEFLGEADRRGRIARGQVADMVLVAGNPLADIEAIRKPRMVMRAGTLYFPTEIYEALGVRPFTTAPVVRAATAAQAAGAPAGSGFGHEHSHAH
ncbi:amidohydrolase family protein [Sandaracinobacter sp. RS1-74]|uniref:amidohydrolase family protein n=1 Tax=Sandaracinobacteroides sayramensis TaxID=2913411 RepID=UPI001EDB51D3|nr:amidohydrolase family protein [Sandaracinobacteroides sayramensis]MCG2842074.1 amidohydrolase family protein [Sandaracinobacteroides sayramensis]